MLIEESKRADYQLASLCLGVIRPFAQLVLSLLKAAHTGDRPGHQRSAPDLASALTCLS